MYIRETNPDVINALVQQWTARVQQERSDQFPELLLALTVVLADAAISYSLASPDLPPSLPLMKEHMHKLLNQAWDAREPLMVRMFVGVRPRG